MALPICSPLYGDEELVNHKHVETIKRYKDAHSEPQTTYKETHNKGKIWGEKYKAFIPPSLLLDCGTYPSITKTISNVSVAIKSFFTDWYDHSGPYC